jgi:NMD protein affecting ribosome stability and mRNA decay
MIMRKCIVCGNLAEIDVFCSDCWLKNKTLFEIKDLKIKICKKCGAYFEKNKWIKTKSLEKSIERVVKNNIKTKNRILEIDIFPRKIGNMFSVTISCKGYIPPCKKPKIENKSIFVKIENSLCENCKKFLGMQYDSVIQLRTKRKINIRNINFSRIEKVKNGYDIYFIKKEEAERMIKRLKQFKIKKSYKLIGEKQGKKIYRTFYSVKDYEEGRNKNRRRKSKITER